LLRWEGNLLHGTSYKTAIKHLMGLKICELSHSHKADVLGANIRAAALNSLRWNIQESQLAESRRGNASDSPTERFGSFPDIQGASNAQHSERRTRKRKQCKRKQMSDHRRSLHQNQRDPPTQPQPSQNTYWPGTHLQLLSTVAGKWNLNIFLIKVLTH
jgi:hypothetical protein